MKQTVMTIAALLAANLGLSQAQAMTLATDFVNDNAPNNLSIKQQKAIFAFSQARASLTVGLIADWDRLDALAREARIADYIDAFYAAAASEGAIRTTITELGSSLLLADALGNAKYLLAEAGEIAGDKLDAVLDDVKAALMRGCYLYRGEVVVPYIPAKIAWGQHGQHFVPDIRPDGPRAIGDLLQDKDASAESGPAQGDEQGDKPQNADANQNDKEATTPAK
ncbi:MAG: hypothetical protein KDK34_00395 [Leptospiraceae bacterium]|nr:hypothetical protein [Leptospiraceae bacterium]